MTRIVQLGLGPLGQQMVRYALQRPNVKLVAVVDPDPAKTGKDVGVVCGSKPLGITVQPQLPTFTGKSRPTVAILSTVSSLEKLLPQVAAAAQAGLHVVSTCEELSYPWQTQPKLARKLDKLCIKHGVSCVGTGINPGFLMDYLPSVLSSVCQEVRSVRVTRVQDASHRRVPFQQKIGAGLTLKAFRAKAKTGTLRHVGLLESIHMIAAALGLKLDKTTETLKPVIAEKQINTGHCPIASGMAAGVEQIGKGYVGNRVIIELRFRAAVGQAQPHDTIEITGSPSIHSTIQGGVNGDISTCAITLNAAESIQRTRHGLITMLDLPTPSAHR